MAHNINALGHGFGEVEIDKLMDWKENWNAKKKYQEKAEIEKK